MDAILGLLRGLRRRKRREAANWRQEQAASSVPITLSCFKGQALSLWGGGGVRRQVSAFNQSCIRLSLYYSPGFIIAIFTLRLEVNFPCFY